MVDIEGQRLYGDVFGYGGTRIGPPDSAMHAARLYGPALASGVYALGSHYARQAVKRGRDYLPIGPALIAQQFRGKRQRVTAGSSGKFPSRALISYPQNHLYNMPRRVRTKRRRAYGRRRRIGRKIRKYRRKYKRYSRLTRYKKLLKDASNRALWKYEYKFGVQGNNDRVMLFCPSQDNANNLGWIAPGQSGLTFAAAPTTGSGTVIGEFDGPNMINSMITAGIIQRDNKKYIIGSRNLKMTITNFQNHEIDLRIYWCKFRKIIPQKWPYATAIPGRGQIDACDFNAFLGQCLYGSRMIGGVNNAMEFVSIAETPFKSPYFTQYVKVLNVEKHHLYSGKCVTTGLKSKKPWLINATYTTSYFEQLAYPQTIFPVIQAWGCPAFERTAGGANDFTKVGRSRVLLGFSNELTAQVYQLNDFVTSDHWINLANPNGLPAANDYATVQKPDAVIIRQS
jgi:hypothetical protein